MDVGYFFDGLRSITKYLIEKETMTGDAFDKMMRASDDEISTEFEFGSTETGNNVEELKEESSMNKSNGSNIVSKNDDMVTDKHDSNE